MRGRCWILLLATEVILSAIMSQSAVSASSSYAWLQFGGDAQHSGNNTQEAILNSSNVASLHQGFRVSLPSISDGEPAYVPAVATPNGTHDLVFLSTRDGHIMALDAHTGATIWSEQYGPGSCIDTNSNPCYTTSSPAVDPNLQYVYSYGLDGYVHKYQSGSGTEVSGNGWPERITLKPSAEKSSPALTIATTPQGTYLYAANGGYEGDGGDYQGHVTTINLASGAQHVFNTLCSNAKDGSGTPYTVHFALTPATPDCSQVRAAVWARGSVAYDPDTNKIYFATGNGDYSPGSFDWGDSVLALNPDGTGSSTTIGSPIDSYTPTNYATLQANDTDLGSTGPAILPSSAVPAASKYKHLAVQSGKDAELRLLNLDDLSGHGGPGNTGGELAEVLVTIPQEVLSQPTVWVNPADNSIWIFVTNNGGLCAFKLTVNSSTGMPGLQSVWSNSMTYRDSLGSSPVIANGVLFDARDNLIEAVDPTTGHQLWKDTTIGGVHWESPVVANGMLYISDQSSDLTAYSLPSASTPVATGWNLIDVPRQGTGISSMSGLITSLDSALGSKAISVAATYANGRFSTYIPGYSSDVALQPSSGIFVNSASSGTWNPAGTPYASGQSVALAPGWNLVAAPYPGSGLSASTIASEASACTVQEVAMYSNGTYQTWTSGGGTLTIPATAGMWIECGSAATWTPS